MSITMSLLHECVSRLTAYPPYLGLLGLKALDVVAGVANAASRKQLDPSRMGDAVPAFVEVTAAIALYLALSAMVPASSMFADAIALIPVWYAAKEGASFLRNLRLLFDAHGWPIPPWFERMSTVLDGIELRAVPADNAG